MSEVKYRPGQKVCYRSNRPAGIDMKSTKIVGFLDKHDNNFKLEHCSVSGRKVARKLEDSKKENRYIISHYFGWHPHVQENLKDKISLNPKTRYYYAYESELSAILDV